MSALEETERAVTALLPFEAFTYEDDARYLKHVAACPRLPSDLYPEVLMCYQEQESIRRAYADGLCWHRAVRYGREVLYPPVGSWERPDWEEVLRRHFPAGALFTYVPKELAERWERELPGCVRVTDRRDDWDYVLDPERTRRLQGKMYASFRQKVNHFVKVNDYSIEPIGAEGREELLALERRLQRKILEGNANLAEAEAEDRAFLMTMERWGKNPRLFGLLLRIEGQGAGFYINEVLPDGRSVDLYTKADHGYRGIYAFLYHTNVEQESGRGISSLNIMSDVGVMGMREAKNDLRPAEMLEKCDVTLRWELGSPRTE